MGLFTRWSTDESTSYLASVSDLMAGLLFIFILILSVAVYSLNASKAETERLTKQLEATESSLQELLVRIRDSLGEKGVRVVIVEENGVLRIPEESLTFPTGKADLNSNSRVVLSILRGVLEKELVCYSRGHDLIDACKETNPNKHTLDAVLIEGHTDNQPYGGDVTGKKNRNLATDRANTVYEELVLKSAVLSTFKNPNNEALFSISGYGSARPVPGHFHRFPTNDALNRRIELRFLMTVPKSKQINSHVQEKNK